MAPLLNSPTLENEASIQLYAKNDLQVSTSGCERGGEFLS